MRYSREVKFYFEGDSQLALTQVPYARKILGEIYNRDRNLGGLYYASRKVTLPNGTVIKATALEPIPVVIIDVTDTVISGEEDASLLLRFRWEPEGILMTPTTLEQPSGWGLPSRVGDATGQKLTQLTAGGALPQVILNRFQNNKYHDKPQFLNGLPTGVSEVFPQDYIPPQTRDSYEEPTLEYTGGLYSHAYGHRTQQWVSYAEESEVAENGHYIFSGSKYQTGVAFDGEGSPIFFIPQSDVTESPTESWYCHRPEELLYTNLTYEYAFVETNLLRSAVGEEPVTRPLRGEINLGVLSAELIALSPDEVFAHSYYGWQPGFRTAVGRTVQAMGQSVWGWFANNVNENIQAYSVLPAEVTNSEELAQYVIGEWEESQRHYLNIIQSNWTANEQFPFHSWTPAGTKGAQMHIGASGGGDFSLNWDFSGGIHQYNLLEVDPPLTDSTVWAQAFVARETWLPPYATSKDYDLGRAGTLHSANPCGRDYYLFTRKVAYENTIYELPEGNEYPAGIAAGEEDDDFQTILGVAPFQKTISSDYSQTWLRVVYWKSSEANDELRSQYPNNPGEQYGTLVVLVCPEGLGDSPILPWLPGENVASWEEEYRETFVVADGWVPECEGAVQFNNAGTQFILELERVGTDFIYEGIRRQDQVNIFSQDTTIEDLIETFYGDFALCNIQRVAHIYDATGSADPTFNELPSDTPPLVADVNTGFPEDARDGFRYEVTLNGDYKMFPHFLTDENGVEAIAWVTLRIDEHWVSQGETGPYYSEGTYDPTNPELNEYMLNRGYRVRKMIFPSGKEVTYMQQYMIQNFCVEWDDSQPKPVGFDYFPGTGENYLGVIHYLDLENENIIYSKQGTVTYNEYYNTDPLGSAVPNAGGGGSWTRGGSKYLLDAFKGADRVQETIAEYDLFVDDPLRWQYMTARGVESRRITVQYGDDLYAPGVTPYTLPLFWEYSGFPPGSQGWYAYVLRCMMPCAIWSDVSVLSGAAAGLLSGNSGSRSFVDSYPTNNYKASVTTRQSFRGEDSTVMSRYYNGEFYRGVNTSGAYHNIAPLFSRDSEVRAKFVDYDGRWIARVEVRHRNNLGLAAPDNQPRPNLEDYVAADFTMNYPYDGQPDPDFKYSLAGLRFLALGELGADASPAVHLKANFNIDEAVGIEDVYDIAPFGRL